MKKPAIEDSALGRHIHQDIMAPGEAVKGQSTERREEAVIQAI
jgi:hypothetical protein